MYSHTLTYIMSTYKTLSPSVSSTIQPAQQNNSLDSGCERGQRHGPEAGRAHGGRLEEADREARAERDDLDGRVADVQHEEKEPVREPIGPCYQLCVLSGVATEQRVERMGGGYSEGDVGGTVQTRDKGRSTHVRHTTIVSRNHVWCDGKR